MKGVGFTLVGFFVAFFVFYLSSTIGSAMGPGPNGIGYVLVALSLLCAVIVICTLLIVDTIIQNSNNA